jgi:hypothetical protein
MRDTKVHVVTSFELKRPTSLVGITFLLGGDNLQVGLNSMDYLLGLSDKVRAKDRPLAGLNPAQRCTASTTIQCFKMCHFESLLITVVVRELNQRQILAPFILIVQHTSSEHILKNLVRSLHLIIDLWMISRIVDQMHPQGSMQLLLEMSNKLGSSVRNDGLGHTMLTQYMSNIQLSVLLSLVVGVHRNEMSRLGKPIDDHPYGIEFAGRER